MYLFFREAKHISEFCDVFPKGLSNETKCGMPFPGSPIGGIVPKEDINSYKNEQPECTATKNPVSGGICCARCQRLTDTGVRGCPVPDKICKRVQQWADTERQDFGLGKGGFKEITTKEEEKTLREKYPGITERYDALFNYVKETQIRPKMDLEKQRDENAVNMALQSFIESKKTKIEPITMLKKEGEDWILVERHNPSSIVKNFGREKPSDSVLSKEDSKLLFEKYLPGKPPQWYLQTYKDYFEKHPEEKKYFEELALRGTEKFKPIDWHLKHFEEEGHVTEELEEI